MVNDNFNALVSANANGLHFRGDTALNTVDYRTPGPTYWWPPPYPYQTIVVTTHRACGCPKCAGDCCDCAECKITRLEKRVRDLEAKE